MRLTVLEHQHLFAPGRAFGQCHASTLTRLPDGSLFCAWFGGSQEGASDVCIYGALQRGERWSAPFLLASGDGEPCWNPVLYTRPDGRTLLYFKRGAPIARWRSYVQESQGCLAWSDARELCPGDEGGVGPRQEQAPSLAGRNPAGTRLHGRGGRLALLCGSIPGRRPPFFQGRGDPHGPPFPLLPWRHPTQLLDGCAGRRSRPHAQRRGRPLCQPLPGRRPQLVPGREDLRSQQQLRHRPLPPGQRPAGAVPQPGLRQLGPPQPPDPLRLPGRGPNLRPPVLAGPCALREERNRRGIQLPPPSSPTATRWI